MKDYMVLLSDEGQVVGIIVIPNQSGQSFAQNVEDNSARIKNLVADAIESGGFGKFDDLQNEIQLTVDSGSYIITIDAGEAGEYSLIVSETFEQGKNCYIAIYKNKPQIEVYANSSYEAQQKAAVIFKAKKTYEVSVYLCEKDGEQVIHIPQY